MLEKLNIILIINFIIFVTYSNCQKNKCALKETCGACIQDKDCVWCNNPFDRKGELQRCQLYTKSFNASWCIQQNIINPKPDIQILRNRPLQSSTAVGKEAVQISPQRVKLKLRPGQEYKLNFKYATAKDYPVDLYYLMDLSASMKVHKVKLSQLGNLLSETMKKLTRNFRLGFGSFVDKVAEPFTSTYPVLLANPCSNCAPAYSFKNHLSLSDNALRFTFEVGRANLSGNLDSPEGGLDALMQAIVCKTEIGWRPKSRHLIVFSTDADYHIAGDGKLAGIVLPNDGKCHMENNEYTHGIKQDYPSIAHIAHVSKENNINLIFAIVKTSEKVNEAYNALKNRIEGSSFGFLSEDSSNVVDLVKEFYDKIVDSVKISDNSDNNIEVKYYSTCLQNSLKETDQCKNLKIGAVVDFTATIKVVKCPENPKLRTQIFEIKPGALDETLTVEIDMICECACEKSGITHASECHNSGTLQCGVCSCDPGTYGTNCHCNGMNTTAVEDVSNCKVSGNSEVCSGLGSCKCNKCDCQERSNKNERIYGKFCECTNYSCQRIAGALCSNNGICDCGKCTCFEGYTGEACECRTTVDTCLDNNGLICNGHGSCKCGFCQCEDSYFGQFCQECPSCEGQLCNVLKDCVECLAYKTGIYETEEACFSNCSVLNLQMIDKIDEETGDEEKICRGMDNETCVFYFKYYYDQNNVNALRVFALKQKQCPEAVNVGAIIGSVIGSILLAGLILLLLWKGLTTVQDRREYAKFENERRNARWDRGDNPLFKNPTTTFTNPTFNKDNDF